jgi:hypothetical protein
MDVNKLTFSALPRSLKLVYLFFPFLSRFKACIINLLMAEIIGESLSLRHCQRLTP